MQKLAEPKSGQDCDENFRAAMSERQAKAQPCFMPLTMNGNDAAKITFSQMWSRFDPMVSAARRKIEGRCARPLRSRSRRTKASP